MKKVLTIDVRKLTHSGIGRYLRNIVPGVLREVAAESVQLIGNPGEIESELGALPGYVTVLADESAPHSLGEQGFAFDSRIGPKPRERRVLWVPHYNIPLLYAGPLVCTVHDMAPLDLPETFGGAKRLLARVLLARVAQRAGAILTPSEYSRDRIVKMLRVPRNCITVTPLAVDAAWPTLADAPAAHAEPGGSPYLLFVGNLKANKNLTALLEALQRMGATAPQLLVAGKTEGFRTADDRARDLARQLGDQVRLLGAVTDAELISLYRGAAAFVMPSLYEGFGLPVLEAMRYGCPVLCSKVTSLPEVAGDAALLFDPRNPAQIAEAIQTALQADPAAHLRQTGLLREAQFTYGAAIRMTAEVLNRSLGVTA